MPLFLVKVRSHLKQWLYWKPPYNEQKKATTMLWSFAREKLLSLQNVKVAFLSVLLETLNRVLLIGDATEDPSHPKVVWPAPSECPTCRSQRTSSSSNFDPQIAFVQGTLWNLTNLVEHNIKVYAGQHLRPIDLTAFRGNKVVEKTLETSFLKCRKREYWHWFFLPSLIPLAQRDVHLQSLYEAEDGSIEDFSTSVQDFCSKYS